MTDHAPLIESGSGSGSESGPDSAPTVEDPTGAPAESVQPAAPRSRRRLRALLRWGAAVLVLGVAGAGTAFAVAAPDRTDLPGLRTPSDGRYTFPQLALPALPSGKLGPFDPKNELNRHYADLRDLLLPAPGEVVSSSGPAPKATSAAECAAAEELFEDPAPVKASLFEDGCRSSTDRSWTTSDGTRTEIRLLAFGSVRESEDFFNTIQEAQLKAIPDLSIGGIDDLSLPTEISGVPVMQHKEIAGEERNVASGVHLWAGDLVATVLMTNPKGVPDAAFRQVADLEAELLD